MARYQARMLNSVNDGIAGLYPFDAPDDLFSESADTIVRRFFEHVDRDIFHHHVGYEMNAAFRNKDGTITAIGSLLLKNDAHLPFLLLISK